MQAQENEVQRNRAESETFVIAKTNEGFRVCSPLTPASQYVVSGLPGRPGCTCPDFARHQGEPEWVCKHILAVLNHTQVDRVSAETAVASTGALNERPSNGRSRGLKDIESAENGAAMMILKRSVSPDGRIDSLSVEFACPIGNTSPDALRSCAEATLRFQSKIVGDFLRTNGKSNGEHHPTELPTNGAVPARMIKVDGMNTQYGRRLFISVQVNGQTLRLFGSLPQLSEAVKSAGFVDLADRITEGVTLDLPCLAITKASGKYVNVERVLPARNGT